MQITAQSQNYNKYQNRAYTSNFRQLTPSKTIQQPNFTSAMNLVTSAANTTAKSTGWYDTFTNWIAKNYYAKFYGSKTAKLIVDHTNSPKWNNMTTHMSALGSTLISGMYAIRTLQNDKLDPEKRKTLAINDGLTWGISTVCAYFLDSKLGNLCDKATTRFAANYMLDNPEAKRTDILGEWHPKDLQQMMQDWYKHVDHNSEEATKLIAKPLLKDMVDTLKADSEETKEIIKLVGEDNFKKLQTEFNKLNKDNKLDPILDKLKPMLKKWAENLAPEKLSKKLSYKNIRDFNLDVLKNQKLTTQIDGIGVLKSLFVFGMVYRYLVPVLVMKPANKLGNYIHEKNAQKRENQNSKQVA